MRYNLDRNPNFRGKRYLTRRSIPRPPSVDFRSKLPPCFDQGEEGSCGPNSASAFLCFNYPDVPAFSRQQIYYNVRVLEGTGNQDVGVETDDLFKVLQSSGAAPETLWPYTPSDFSTPPSAIVIEAALKYKISDYSQLASEEDFLDCLADGSPFILGFNVYEQFESDQMAQTGIMTLPQSGNLLGGHDVLIVGYDTNFFNNPDFVKSGISEADVSSTMLLVRNSWGPDWGLGGHFYMPIEYAVSTQTGGDAWVGKL